MTEAEFRELSIHDKGIWVFTDGKFISYREYYYQKIDLYLFYGFYVEVYIDSERKMIKNIKVVFVDESINQDSTEGEKRG